MMLVKVRNTIDNVTVYVANYLMLIYVYPPKHPH